MYAAIGIFSREYGDVVEYQRKIDGILILGM